MFGTIRKHQTWLWVVIIGVMIIGMITWQNSLGKSGSAAARAAANFGVIDNRVVTEAEYQHAYVEASLMCYLRTGAWPDSGAPRAGWDQVSQTYQRLFLLR